MEHHIILSEHSSPFTLTKNKGKYLMDIFLKEQYHKRELISINKCRKFLWVLTVGDIITGDGTKVSHQILKGQRSSALSSNMPWPNQADPGPKAWSVWRKAIKRMLVADNKLIPSLRPTHWNESKQRTFNWFYHRGLNRLMQRSHNNKWSYYNVKSIRRGQQSLQLIYHFRGNLNSISSGSDELLCHPCNI